MFIDPMLLATAPGPFSDSRYIFEPKIDGHRLIYSQHERRGGLRQTAKRGLMLSGVFWSRLQMIRKRLSRKNDTAIVPEAKIITRTTTTRRKTSPFGREVFLKTKTGSGPAPVLNY